jgi:hypothetical protein
MSYDAALKAARDEAAFLRKENAELKRELARYQVELEKINTRTQSGLYVDELKSFESVDEIGSDAFWSSHKNDSVSSSWLAAEKPPLSPPATTIDPRKKTILEAQKALRLALSDSLAEYACCVLDRIARDE